MNTIKFYPLSNYIAEYKELNTNDEYKPVAVGKYGIRKREDIYKKELAKSYSKNKVIRKNTLTVGMGSNQIDIGILDANEIYSVSPAYHTYKINGINNKYLDYCLKQRNNDMFERYVKKSARQGKTIDLKEWLKYEIPIYDDDSQAEIVNILSLIENMLHILQKKLDGCEELVKARFVEMFGDPFINEKGWKTGKLSELCKINYYKGEIENNDGKVWLLNLDMIESNTGRLLDYVYENENNIPSSTMKFEKDCVLYSKLRPYLNKVIIPNKSGYATTELISMKTDIINNQFLKTLLMQQSFVDFANGAAYGAKMPRASVDSIKSFNLINPPKELQEQFASFVEQIDKSKFIVQKQLEETQKLFDSLMQKYFG